jgi:hypothetical protein
MGKIIKKNPSFFHHSFVLKFSIGTPSLPKCPIYPSSLQKIFCSLKKFNLPLLKNHTFEKIFENQPI